MAASSKTISVSELPSGTMKTVRVGEDDVLLVNIGDEFYGMGAVCKHEEWDLSEGSIHGTRVVCAGHGASWDLTTGKAEFDEDLDDEPLYDIREEDGYLYVSRRD